MTPEKDRQLCEKYPKIFRDQNATMRNTARGWGFECGDGWYDLIDALCNQIQNHIDWKIKNQNYMIEKGKISAEEVIPEDDLQVYAVQVKEKFGGLRFYVFGGDDEVRGMIQMAESFSYRVCDTCGNKGILRKEGWWRTNCDPCEKTRYERKSE